MKRRAISVMMVIFLAGILALSGCATYNQANNTQKGAGIGAVAGGVLGAIIGHQSGHEAGGAVIGALAGGGLGALIGHRMDQQAQELKQVPGVKNVDYNPQKKTIDATINILFDFNKATIKPSEQVKLNDLANVFSKYPENIVTIKGYTDNVGTPQYNLKLSQERADAVANYLRSKNLNIAGLSAIGYGESDPVATNDTAEGRAKNRRVEIHIAVDPNRVPQNGTVQQGQ